MKRISILALASIFLGSFSAGVSARTLEVGASQVAAIASPETSKEVRLLVSFAMPEEIAGKQADFACVSFEADCSSGGSAVSFQAFALTKGWDEKTASWTGTWDTPGGDWDRSLSSYSVAETENGKTLEFDITDFVNRWLKEPSKNFGIIVKMSGPFQGTLSVDKGLAPKLRILY